MSASSSIFLQGLQPVLKADLITSIISAAGFGVLFHHSVLRNIEVDIYIYYFLSLFISTTIGLGFTYLSIKNFTIVQALARTTSVVTAFYTGILFSIGIYRLFFHRLRSFPGPLGAKLTRFYTVRKASKNVQYYKEVAKMHEKYGDFFRTGPREICIVRKSAIPLIYGPQSECLKSTWYSQVSSDCTRCSIHMTRDFDDHRRRRKAWDRGLAIKALNTYEPRIKSKVELFIKQLSSHTLSSKPFDGTAWSMFLSFDVMGDVGFGKDFGCLESGTEHAAIKGVHDHMEALGILSNVPWLLNILGCIPGATAGYTGFFSWCAAEINAKQKQWDPEQYPQDIASWLLKAFTEKDVSASPSKASLHEDSRVVIIAGRPVLLKCHETTATTFASVIYFLCRYPAVLRKLQTYLDAAMPNGEQEWTYEKVKAITYLDDIINETLRLKPALLTGGYRVTPAKGIQTDVRYYRDPLEFIPERYGERKEEMRTEGAPYFPFSVGAYSCPGKNLAFMTLRIALSRVAQQFNLAFAPGETGNKFDEDAMDTFTTTLSSLMVQVTQRK
ncbi:putative benzoate 4-monooxygenase cytochrome P450 [Cadophora sp. MPI-SDFR-AT-0126]|nr:putative benzoate 4-monooxygenase cytochrome P450 [Leotiomycetes sp. MPI-SDFR-AT-0126]